MIKVWCLHCEMVSEVKPIENGFYRCPKCDAGFMDVEVVGTGFTSQAYPNMKYDDFVVDKSYPLYPDKV